MAKAYRTDLDLIETWGPGVTHWSVGDKFYAVAVDEDTDGKLPNFFDSFAQQILDLSKVKITSGQVLPRPTTLVRCDENGVAIDADTSTPAIELLTEFECPAGTSARDALIQAGYEVD